MSINLNNYEIYFIDFFDGNLTAEGEKELMLFLDSNPELKEEFESFENIKIKQEEILFSKKSLIKKTEIHAFASVSEGNYESVFVAFYEGDLSKKEKIELEQFLVLNPLLKSEFEIHAKLRLSTQEFVFENKNQLKKRIAIPAWQFRTAAIAAAIALLMSTFWFLNENTGIDKSAMLKISIAESRNILLNNTASFEIAEREIIPAVFETELVAQAELKAKPIISTKMSAEKTAGIRYLRNQGQAIALTGEIECAKLMTGNQNNNLDFASAKADKKNSSLLAKVLSKNTNKVINAIKPNNLQYAKSNENDPALVKFLAGSVNVFNTITGSEIEQLKVYDGNGKLINYKIETELLTLNKNLNSPGTP